MAWYAMKGPFYQLHEGYHMISLLNTCTVYASSQIGAAMLDSQLGRDLWRHARVKREVFREGSAAVIWLV